MKLCGYYKILILSILTAEPIYAADLTIAVQSVNSSQGKIQVGLFSSAANFPEGKPDYGVILRAEPDSSAVAVFADLPIGEYAVAVFHDENNNDELDKGLFGIPKEPYGFTLPTTFGAPDFDDARFSFGTESLRLPVKLK